MWMTRYSASDAYYPQTLSMLRLDRPLLVNVSDPEREQLRALLPANLRPGADSSLASQLQRLVGQLREATTRGDHQERRG